MTNIFVKKIAVVRIRETEWNELGFRTHGKAGGSNPWRIVDLSTQADIGYGYRTQEKLLADLPRVAHDFGATRK